MLEQDAHEAIIRHWKTGWEALRPTIPFTLTNEVDESLDEWVRVTIQPATSRLATLGPPLRRERRGTIGVQIYTLANAGSYRMSALADDVRAVLEAQAIASITGDGEPVITYGGASQSPQTDGKWAMQFVSVMYRYDDVR